MIRIYLTGRVTIAGDTTVDEAEFPGPLGRVLIAVLGLTRGPIGRAPLADILWDHDPPSPFDSSLNPLVSKLRSLLVKAGAERGVLSSSRGALELRRSRRLWIDVEEATRALDAAEGAMRRGSPREAWSQAAVATAVFRRPFLEGVTLEWVESRRRQLRNSLIRGLEVATDVWARLDDPSQAVVAARQLIEADPFRETSYARLMRAHMAEGNPAEALRTYSRCAELLRDELGVLPSAGLQDVYETALAASGS